MLKTWKNEHDMNLTKFMNDQNSSLTKLVSEIAELIHQNISIQKSNLEIEKVLLL